MNIFQTTILGIIQGLTEFLPVSSSGHLVLFQNLLGFREPELLLDCSLHLGTLLAVCVYFRNDLKKIVTEIWKGDFKNPHASVALWIVVGSVPTAVIGLVFKAPLERLFGSVTIVGAMLIATGIIVALTRMIPEGYGTRTSVGLLAALAVGTAQGLAIIPGISRSGTTIVCALLLGLTGIWQGAFLSFWPYPQLSGHLRSR